MLRTAIAPISAAALLLVLASCASIPASADGNSPAVPLDEDTILIDVRTPAEYAEGHLDGALLLDLNGGDFAAALPDLDPNADYLVYCRSGNRSGQAIAMMNQRGIGEATNLGSLDEAATATGIDIVTR